jgi:hypothetical protein
MLNESELSPATLLPFECSCEPESEPVPEPEPVAFDSSSELEFPIVVEDCVDSGSPGASSPQAENARTKIDTTPLRKKVFGFCTPQNPIMAPLALTNHRAFPHEKEELRRFAPELMPIAGRSVPSCFIWHANG